MPEYAPEIVTAVAALAFADDQTADALFIAQDKNINDQLDWEYKISGPMSDSGEKINSTALGVQFFSQDSQRQTR